MVRVYSNKQNQLNDFKLTMNLLGDNEVYPNVRAANSLINFYNDFRRA